MIQIIYELCAPVFIDRRGGGGIVMKLPII